MHEARAHAHAAQARHMRDLCLPWARTLPEAAQAAGNTPELLLQPGWQSSSGAEQALEFVRAQPAWRLSLQSHKWLGVR